MKKIYAIILALLSLLYISYTPTVAKEPTAYGDMDTGFEITATDALIILQGVVSKIQLTDAQTRYADVDVNGEVNATDALTTLQYAVGKIKELPTKDHRLINEEELLIDKGEVLIENGAYGEDAYADNSFHITTEGLQDNTVYILNTSMFTSSDARYNLDAMRFVTCLQGLINRDYGITHTTLIYIIPNYTTQEYYWYKKMTAEGNQFNGMKEERLGSVIKVLQTFSAQIEQCGIVLWDQSVPATSNVANTICGVDGYLPVKYETKSNSFYNRLKETFEEMQITLKEFSLVGKFTGSGTIPDTTLKSSGSTKCDAYLWAMEKYLDRCTVRYMAYMVDAATTIEGHPLSNQQYSLDYTMLYIPDYDYFIARRCFFVDLSAFPAEAPCDDPNQPVGTDAATLRRILLERYNRANGNFGQITGFPPFFFKYTNDFGNSSMGYNSVASEFLTMSTFTAYNLADEGDCPSPTSCWNTSFTYKYLPSDVSFENSEPDETIEYDSNVRYFTITLGDYDSASWPSYFMYKYWDDPNRGTLPLYWTINPNEADRIPQVFEYMYEEKTDNDFFSAGDSGAGYIWPCILEQGHTIKTYSDISFERVLPDGIEKFKVYTKRYYDIFDCDITGFLLDVEYPITYSKLLDMYNYLSPVGSFLQGADSQSSWMYNGVPYIKKITTDGNGTDMFSTIRKNPSRFTAFHTCIKSPTDIKNSVTEITELANKKELLVQYVDPYTFFRFMRESNQIPEWKPNN